MTAFRYLDTAERFDEELLEILTPLEGEKVAQAEEPHPSSGALARLKKTPLDEVRERIAKRAESSSRTRTGGDPEARALLAEIVTPEKTAAVEDFLEAAGKEH